MDTKQEGVNLELPLQKVIVDIVRLPFVVKTRLDHGRICTVHTDMRQDKRRTEIFLPNFMGERKKEMLQMRR